MFNAIYEVKKAIILGYMIKKFCHFSEIFVIKTAVKKKIKVHMGGSFAESAENIAKN